MLVLFFFLEHSAAYEMRISGCSSDVCSSDLSDGAIRAGGDIQAGWGISAGSRLDCGGALRAAWDIRTGQDLHVAGAVLATQGLDVGGSLHSGQGIRSAGDRVGKECVSACSCRVLQ